MSPFKVIDFSMSPGKWPKPLRVFGSDLFQVPYCWKGVVCAVSVIQICYQTTKIFPKTWWTCSFSPHLSVSNQLVDWVSCRRPHAAGDGMVMADYTVCAKLSLWIIHDNNWMPTMANFDWLNSLNNHWVNAWLCRVFLSIFHRPECIFQCKPMRPIVH